MGLSIAAIQNTLEMYNLGYFKNSSSVFEMGSQELHLKKNDLKELFEYACLKSDLVDSYPNNNFPEQPRTPAKYFYQSLGFKEYQCMDLNGEHGAIKHDYNLPYEDKNKFNKFDLVTDHGACEHAFNIAECYKTMHNLTKPGGFIVVDQIFLDGNGYFLFDKSFFEGIAAANNYKIIFTSSVITTGTKTKNGSNHQFHIPLTKSLFKSLDLTKISNVGSYGVFQKQDNEKFQFPYQRMRSHERKYMDKTYNYPGFNRLYFKDPMGYSYIPSATITKTIEESSFKILVREFFKRLLKKILK
tara:strand:+ start:1438 stop:2337 length:900 start_codon:yes stop_codon:yes gene_type:complete